MQQEWFASWFDSPYYHILYRHRDEIEAASFLDNILEELKIGKEMKILDLACGKGRHSQYLNQKGYDVTGIDYSSGNIAYCKQFENKTLRFYEHDMREPFMQNHFDLILNLFTSFGYFDTEYDNIATIEAMAYNLKNRGMLLIDFLNAEHTIGNIVPLESKNIEGIDFKITKILQGKNLIKKIKISDDDYSTEFQEKVSMLVLDDFKRYFALAGIKLEKVFGNYKLESFNAETSERLIIIGSKI